MRVEVRVLGSFQILVGGQERTLAARKQRSLIATLALHARPVTREQLTAVLWPESDDAHGRESLRHALYRIRAEVGHELITSTHDQLQIADGVSVDVRELERGVALGTDEDLARAVSAYGGDLCPEVDGVESEAERARLRGLFASAGEKLAARQLATDPASAADTARRVIEVDAYREEAHRIVLRALAARGDLAAAAVHYRRLTALLRNELGIDPSPETKQLYADLPRSTAPAAAAGVRRPRSSRPPR